MLGRDDTDPLFLQMKEAESSVLEEFCGRSDYTNHGHRVVAGQRLMQAAGDVFLGWVHVAAGLDGVERDFYVRQLRDWKGSTEVDQMVPEALKIYARLSGWTLARAHARSGDPIAIAAYLGKSDVFDRAIASFSASYADQNERDYDPLQRAVASGRVVAETGVGPPAREARAARSADHRVGGAPWQRFHFLPLPHVHASLRPRRASACT